MMRPKEFNKTVLKIAFIISLTFNFSSTSLATRPGSLLSRISARITLFKPDPSTTAKIPASMLELKKGDRNYGRLIVMSADEKRSTAFEGPISEIWLPAYNLAIDGAISSKIVTQKKPYGHLFAFRSENKLFVKCPSGIFEQIPLEHQVGVQDIEIAAGSTDFSITLTTDTYKQVLFGRRSEPGLVEDYRGPTRANSQNNSSDFTKVEPYTSAMRGGSSWYWTSPDAYDSFITYPNRLNVKFGLTSLAVDFISANETQIYKSDNRRSWQALPRGLISQIILPRESGEVAISTGHGPIPDWIRVTKVNQKSGYFGYLTTDSVNLVFGDSVLVSVPLITEAPIAEISVIRNGALATAISYKLMNGKAATYLTDNSPLGEKLLVNERYIANEVELSELASEQSYSRIKRSALSAERERSSEIQHELTRTRISDPVLNRKFSSRDISLSRDLSDDRKSRLATLNKNEVAIYQLNSGQLVKKIRVPDEISFAYFRHSYLVIRTREREFFYSQKDLKFEFQERRGSSIKSCETIFR